MKLDLSDPAVLQMARQNHVPEETWLMGGELASVSCGECGNGWPCETVTLIRENNAHQTKILEEFVEARFNNALRRSTK